MYVPGLHDEIGDIVKRYGVNPDERLVGLVAEYLSKEDYDLEELDDDRNMSYVITIYNFVDWLKETSRLDLDTLI